MSKTPALQAIGNSDVAVDKGDDRRRQAVCYVSTRRLEGINSLTGEADIEITSGLVGPLPFEMHFVADITVVAEGDTVDSYDWGLYDRQLDVVRPQSIKQCIPLGSNLGMRS